MAVPSRGHIKAPEAFKDDLAVLERYQAFSAEIVRISLLGLSALGALIFKAVIDAKPDFDQSVKGWLMAAAVMFGISAAAALLHRYCSSDSMACQLELLRLEKEHGEAEPSIGDEARKKSQEKIDKECRNRNRMMTLSTACIATAAGSLALGSIAFVVAVGAFLFGK